jgi:short-subunit dehydrogenase
MKNPRHILITGASSGIGAALALRYAAPGVFLALSGRNADRLKDVAVLCRAKGSIVFESLIDVKDAPAMVAWIEETDRQYPLDLVVANAGISGGTAGVMHHEPMDQVRQIFDTNLYGVINTIQPIIPRMINRGCGQVAIISSLAGFRGWPGAPAYSASKGAVRFYGEALRGALSHTGVAVNVICPGFVVSRMTDANQFPMPFLMDTDKAAAVIVGGLSRNRGRIAFPWPTHFASWFLSLLPDWLVQKILIQMPKKQ